MTNIRAVELRRHSHAELTRGGGALAAELAQFFRTHQRSAVDAAAVADALYAYTLRDISDRIVGAVTVNMPADLAAAAATLPGTPRPAHLISHLAVHPEHRRAGLGRQLVAAVRFDLFTRRQELVIALAYAVDHSDEFWNRVGYTLTRRAMPAVLPAAVVGLAAPAGAGISAGNTTHPARFVYRDLTAQSSLLISVPPDELPVLLELTPAERRIFGRNEGTP